MGRRYERPGSGADDRAAAGPAARGQTDEDRAQAAWRALDRGEDPTAIEGNERAEPPLS